MRKFIICLSFLVLCGSMAFGQEPQQTEPEPAPMGTEPIENEEIRKTDSVPNAVLDAATLRKLAEEEAQSGSLDFIGGISLGWRYKKDSDAGSKVFGSLYHLELGKIGKKVPIFGTIGLGWKYTDVTVDIPGSSKDYNTISNLLRATAYVGYRIVDDWNVSVRGGVVRNYQLSYKVNDEKQDLSGVDRVSWNGSVKLVVGIVMVEYEFPFNSNAKGAWMIGVCIGQ